MVSDDMNLCRDEAANSRHNTQHSTPVETKLLKFLRLVNADKS